MADTKTPAPKAAGPKKPGWFSRLVDGLSKAAGGAFDNR